jgi:hypothetical protein
MTTHRRALLLHLAILAAMWMAAIGSLMVLCGLLPEDPWDVVPAAREAGFAALAAAIAIYQLAQG